MGAFDKCNAAGWFDPHEPSYTDDELAEALRYRVEHCPQTATRADNCPHPTPCYSVADCIERIAWYLRHRAAIEAAIAMGGDAVAGFVL